MGAMFKFTIKFQLMHQLIPRMFTGLYQSSYLYGYNTTTATTTTTVHIWLQEATLFIHLDIVLPEIMDIFQGNFILLLGNYMVIIQTLHIDLTSSCHIMLKGLFTEYDM